MCWGYIFGSFRVRVLGNEELGVKSRFGLGVRILRFLKCVIRILEFLGLRVKVEGSLEGFRYLFRDVVYRSRRNRGYRRFYCRFSFRRFRGRGCSFR